MKYLAIVAVFLLAGCDKIPDIPVQATSERVEVSDNEGCTLETTSKLSAKHRVSDIQNLVKDKVDMGYMGRCTVKFDLVVNGQKYHLVETEEGLEQLESLCYYARERARRELLLDLAGDFESESELKCKMSDT
jgi:hypothetical protein